MQAVAFIFELYWEGGRGNINPSSLAEDDKNVLNILHRLLLICPHAYAICLNLFIRK